VDKKDKKIHNKPSKLGTYLGKKAGVDANFEQESDDFLQDSDENLVKPVANSDALFATWVDVAALQKEKMAFDHYDVIQYVIRTKLLARQGAQ